MSAKFDLGQIVITALAAGKLDQADVARSLARPIAEDWGELCSEDRQENELSLLRGFRLFSVYRDSSGTKFYVITEADRSVTTVLLSEDY